jgi:hypothetical protein
MTSIKITKENIEDKTTFLGENKHHLKNLENELFPKSILEIEEEVLTEGIRRMGEYSGNPFEKTYNNSEIVSNHFEKCCLKNTNNSENTNYKK